VSTTSEALLLRQRRQPPLQFIDGSDMIGDVRNAAVPRLHEEMHTCGVAVNLNDLAFELFTSAEVHVLSVNVAVNFAVSCSRVVQRGGAAGGRWGTLSNSADRYFDLC
jgi:hypothetical protein